MRWLLGFALSSAIWAQAPFVSYGGVFNAASYTPAGLPHGALPRGGLITLFGRNLGPATPVSATAFPLGTNLGGVRLQVWQGAQAVDAFPVFVSATQINAILPSRAPLGKATLQVLRQDVAGNRVPVEIVERSFGIFTVSSAGYGPAIVTNFESAESQPLNSLEQVARRGQVITIWGTGLGPVAFADNNAPAAGDVTSDVSVYVGGQLAERLYAGRAPCCAALDQIVVRIPAGAPHGCWVPLQVRAGGIPSNTATLAIGAAAGACDADGHPLVSAIRQGGKVARVLTVRKAVRSDLAVAQPREFTTDGAFAQFAEYAADPFGWQVLDALPPVGSCVSYATRGIALDWPVVLSGLRGQPLAGGERLRLQGRGEAFLLPLPNLSHLFSVSNVLSALGTAFFGDNEELRVSGEGAGQVPSFEWRSTPNLRLPWLNRDVQRVVRSQPFAMQWSPQATGVVVAFGIAEASRKNASALFACTGRASDGNLTVPAYILQTLPREPRYVEGPTGMLGLMYLPSPAGHPFVLPGYAVAQGLHVNLQLRTVAYR